MRTIPDKCMDVNITSSFCDCIGEAESADVAAQGFCALVKRGEKNVTGNDLAELKKALMDLEDRTEKGK